MRSLTTPWALGGRTIANRLVLAPLAGIGNWFVRLQAKRHGAGLVVSEMVSSFGLKYGDARTEREFLRIHPGRAPDLGAAVRPRRRRDARGRRQGGRGRRRPDRHQHGLPGAGRCARPAPAPRCSTTTTRRSRSPGGARGQRAAGHGQAAPRPAARATGTACVLARRLVDEAGVAGIAFHPRHASQQHKGKPDYALAARAGGRARRAGDRLRRAAATRRRRCARSTSGRGGGHARARLAGQPVAVRAPAGPARGRADAAPRSARSCSG